MDFLDTKNVYFNGEEHIKVYYEGDLVWSKMEGTINVDHARTRDGAIAGVYDANVKGFIVEPNDILILKSPRTWGGSTKMTDLRNGRYLVENNDSNAGGWGIVTDEVLSLKNGQKYVLTVEIDKKDTDALSYNYIISADGNQKVGNITLKGSGFQTYTLEIIPNKDRSMAGILIGSDKRVNTGSSFEIRNIRLIEI